MDSLLRKLLTMESVGVLDYMYQRAGGIRGNGYWYRPGAGPLLFQAHTDTVRHGAPPKKFHERNGVVWTDGILGADDRAGVYALTGLIGNHDVSLLCTDQEETGGIGMTDFLKEHNSFPGINLAIALDRQGVGEYVVYNDIPREVHEYIQRFGFHEHDGSFSDIMLFTEETGIPSVNLSVGYYNQHTAGEFLCIDELRLTIDRLRKMIRQPIEGLYRVEKEIRRWRGIARSYRTGWPDDDAQRFEDSYGEFRMLRDDELLADDSGYVERCDMCDLPARYITEEGCLLCEDCLMYLQAEDGNAENECLADARGMLKSEYYAQN